MLIGDADLLMSMCWCLCVDIDLLMLMCWFIDVDVAVDVSASWRRSWITSSCLLGTRSVCWRRGRLATPTPAPATSSAATTTSSTRPGGWFGLEVHYVEWVSKQSNYFIRTLNSGKCRWFSRKCNYFMPNYSVSKLSRVIQYIL